MACPSRGYKYNVQVGGLGPQSKSAHKLHIPPRIRRAWGLGPHSKALVSFESFSLMSATVNAHVRCTHSKTVTT